ncbi:hypothetical protein KJA16_00535 [Patescibacteria group bacterium]|nr:hypothetical protein [Patescibacteria group bacterium]
MNTLYTGFIIVAAIVFLVSLIEYLTGAEREGLKFFIFVIVAFLIFSFIASSIQ